jgi:hypothetical protein
VKAALAHNSKQQGFRNSRLPQLSAKEIDYIKGKPGCLHCRVYYGGAGTVK